LKLINLFLDLDDVVYNQTLGGPGGVNTLDKRRDIRDELGYIAPPNRKLPPVPGTSYNTCDRIKRGTVISNFHFTRQINYFMKFLKFSQIYSKCSMFQVLCMISNYFSFPHSYSNF
jgi:hypothetical protein